jgi:hypothetical protein
MTRNIGLHRHPAASLSIGRQTRRIPRGLAMLRALRLRLAAESRPHFSQMEFRFSK